MIKHTQTATVREMRTLTNTSKTLAADAAKCLETCTEQADLSKRSADIATGAETRAKHAQHSAEHAAWRADRSGHEAKAAATIAADAARDARKASRAIIIALLLAILADAALHFFTH